jgi:hypothetical protein
MVRRNAPAQFHGARMSAVASNNSSLMTDSHPDDRRGSLEGLDLSGQSRRLVLFWKFREIQALMANRMRPITLALRNFRTLRRRLHDGESPLQARTYGLRCCGSVCAWSRTELAKADESVPGTSYWSSDQRMGHGRTFRASTSNSPAAPPPTRIVLAFGCQSR